jgi:hypothetical protein
MNTKQLTLGKTLLIAAASKVAVHSTLAHADSHEGGGQGKLNDMAQPERTHELHMDQIGTPIDILAPPTADFVMDFDSDEFDQNMGGKMGSGDEGENVASRSLRAGEPVPVNMPMDGNMDPNMPPDDGMNPNMPVDGSMDPNMPVDGSMDPNMPMDGNMDPNMPPDNGMDPDMPMDGGGKGPGMEEPVMAPTPWAHNGVIYAGDVDDFTDVDGIRPKVDFVISGIDNTQPIDLYLLYNSRKNGENEPPVLKSNRGGGQLRLPADEKMQFIAGVRLQPEQTISGMEPLMDQPTPLGERVKNVRAAVISVSLAKLSQGVQNGRLPDEIYFQAAAFPAGSLDPNEAQFSEVDHYLIDVPREEDNHRGSKADAMGGQQNQTGSTAGQSATGGKGKQ